VTLLLTSEGRKQSAHEQFANLAEVILPDALAGPSLLFDQDAVSHIRMTSSAGMSS
jgi:hypothetical protein